VNVSVHLAKMWSIACVSLICGSCESWASRLPREMGIARERVPPGWAGLLRAFGAGSALRQVRNALELK